MDGKIVILPVSAVLGLLTNHLVRRRFAMLGLLTKQPLLSEKKAVITNHKNDSALK
ncbi:hypothetical protein [uncultured Cytophaga sp.]|uniref:hypothetical protein n=1 Tax=uncultured Cytophaga sp. TaxID=160238 RepID=UPI0026263FE1|nr:hypothetical protein [uncultured Cytophaga sp.]